MQSIFSSSKINKRLFVFLFFFLISIGLLIESHLYHRSRVISSANWLAGSVFNIQHSINSYLKLKEYNNILILENKYLRSEIFSKSIEDNSEIDIMSEQMLHFKFNDANVIKNSFFKPINYITINKGSLDGVEQEMGVISSPYGVVGIVENVSLHFASVRSILGTNVKINASIKNSKAFGTITWEGTDPYKLKLKDIPKLVNVSVGDTIVTAGMSYIFPRGINIGTVESFKKHSFDNYYTIDVNLLNDMTQLGLVYLVKNNFKKELKELDSSEPYNKK